jgi:hypothetical protein
MPLDPITVGGIMRTSLLGAGLVGIGSSQLAAALTGALCTYGTTTMSVGTVDVGTAGAGKGTGIGVIVPQPVLAASLATFLPSNGIAGLSMPQLVLGVSTGYSMALSGAIINTFHPSVGVGTGKLQISPNTIASIGVFIQAFLAAGLSGSMAIPLATAVAEGLDAVLPVAMGVVAIVGSPSVISSSGAGSGKLS